MKRILISCHQIIKVALIFVLFISCTVEEKPSEEGLTTIILVRHAEKIDNSSDPDLSEAGYNRADELAEMFSRIKFDAVYSTDFIRTRKTAEPIAEANKVSLQEYDHTNPAAQAEQWLRMHEGETILVSGHSNSTPTFANAILGESHFESSFDETDYGNILAITISREGDRKLLHLIY